MITEASQAQHGHVNELVWTVTEMRMAVRNIIQSHATPGHLFHETAALLTGLMPYMGMSRALQNSTDIVYLDKAS